MRNRKPEEYDGRGEPRAEAEPAAGGARRDARQAGADPRADEARAHPGAAARDHRRGGPAFRGVGPGHARGGPPEGAGSPARPGARAATGRGPARAPARDRKPALRGAGPPPRPTTPGRPRGTVAPDGATGCDLREHRLRIPRCEEEAYPGGDGASARDRRPALQAHRTPPRSQASGLESKTRPRSAASLSTPVMPAKVVAPDIGAPSCLSSFEKDPRPLARNCSLCY